MSTFPRQPGMRAITAARAIIAWRDAGGVCDEYAMSCYIDAEFYDLHDRLAELGACSFCGGQFKHAELMPSSSHPEAAPICTGCIDLRAAREDGELLREENAAMFDKLDESCTGLRDDGTEYCVYCDWEFGKRYPDENSPPQNHRPECILRSVAGTHPPAAPTS